MIETGVKRIVILHLGNYLLMPDSGVAQKTFALVDAMKAAGVVVHCVAFPFLYSGTYTPNGSVEVIFEKEADVYAAISRYFKTQLTKDDIVLFRYPVASAGLAELARNFGQQIILEHNTIEGVEVLMLQKIHLSRQPFSLSPRFLWYMFQTMVLKRTDEVRYGRELLSHVLGGICVSVEIEQYERSRYRRYNTTVVANGGQIPSKTLGVSEPFQQTLRVCMIIGSAAVWHGYDRMFEGLKQFDASDVKICIDIIGMVEPNQEHTQKIGEHTVNWLGVMKREEIALHLEKCHLAAGTLALFRKKMKEASPLKVRECLMLGMPMLLGYDDTDVSRDERFKPYTLQISNTGAPIDWHEVVAFYRKLSENPHHRQEIAQLAADVLSMHKKAERYLSFIRERAASRS